MKRINLITTEACFTLDLSMQKKIIYILFFLFLVYSGLRGFYDHNELQSNKQDLLKINQEINQLKLTLSQKRSIDERSINVEKEFSSIASDYQIIKKDFVIRDVFAMISKIIPPNTWITSLEFRYYGEKSLLLRGKSLYKEEIFAFLKNSNSMGKNSELITIQADGVNAFNFEIKLELI
jgi:hypothetical protein